jgi:hypothetical protein
MCAERVASLRKILQNLAERQPKIVLHRVEKIFPALKESLVRVLCLNAQETVSLSCSLYIRTKEKGKVIPGHY